MSSSAIPSTTANLRHRGEKSESTTDDQPLKTTRSHATLMADHPDIKPLATSSESTSAATDASASSRSTLQGNQIVHYLLKPFYFLLFVLLHLGHEVMISWRTFKILLQVFFLPNQFPVAPEVVRVLRMDLEGKDKELLTKRPSHLAVVLPVAKEDGAQGDEDWEKKVVSLAQWSVASGIKTLSIMRADTIEQEMLESLQEHIEFELKKFYIEEKSQPVILARTLKPLKGQVEEERFNLSITDSGVTVQGSVLPHGGRHYDLDVVILSPEDGHDRLAGHARALGEAARRKEIKSDDISIEFMDKLLSGELSEPELIIILKDELDLSSYPPWHIRLTEI
ncbi:hypothetical protein BGZ94_007852 [Podila epigama]|nr:hypothetical protein BGZ94_007852 [Podila epigama]